MGNSYIENYDGSDRTYFEYDPLFFELTKINVDDFLWKSPASYDDAGMLLPAEYIPDSEGGTLSGATLTVSSVRSGKQHYITSAFMDELLERHLSGEEQTIFHAGKNKSYTGFLQMPKFSPIQISGWYSYTFELILTV